MQIFHPSVQFADAVLNFPAVRATMAQGGYRLSAAEFLQKNYALAFEGGVMFFERLADKVVEGHVAVLPGYWGPQALSFGKAAIGQMFMETGSVKLLAAAPRQLPSVAGYCRRLGLKPEGVDLFQEYFSTEVESWAA